MNAEADRMFVHAVKHMRPLCERDIYRLYYAASVVMGCLQSCSSVKGEPDGVVTTGAYEMLRDTLDETERLMFVNT